MESMIDSKFRGGLESILSSLRALLCKAWQSNFSESNLLSLQDFILQDSVSLWQSIVFKSSLESIVLFMLFMDCFALAKLGLAMTEVVDSVLCGLYSKTSIESERLDSEMDLESVREFYVLDSKTLDLESKWLADYIFLFLSLMI